MLLANSGQAACRANDDIRVVARGTPATQSEIRWTLIAAAVATCCRRALANPMYRQSRKPNPRIVPGRLVIPLIGEVEPERALDDRRLQGETFGALDLLGELATDRVGNIDLAILECGKPRRLIGNRNCSPPC